MNLLESIKKAASGRGYSLEYQGKSLRVFPEDEDINELGHKETNEGKYWLVGLNREYFIVTPEYEAFALTSPRIGVSRPMAEKFFKETFYIVGNNQNQLELGFN